MKRIAIVLLFLLSLFFVASGFAQTISSNILIEQAREYDGTEIEFYGEVVGEVMKRGDFTWINIFDNFNAVGIWAKADEAAMIKFAGDYDHRGDTVIVRGIFHRACPQHGGDLDIHATNIVKIKEGHRLEHIVPREKSKAMRTLFFLLLAVAVMVLTTQKKRKKYERTSF